MAGDKFDQLYNALKADGAVSGTREHFRQFVYAPGKQGYNNRKQLYDALYADGAVSSKSYEEFAQRLGLHAVNPKPRQQKPVQPVKKLTMKQRAQEVAAQYQKPRQQKVQQPRTAASSGTDYMQNWRLMHMRNDQMNPMQQAQASNARARMQRAQEQSARQEQQRATPISRSRITPTAKNFNETMQQLSTPEARQARAKQQREDDARALAQYEVEGNKFVRNDGQSEGILGNDLLKLVDSSMNEAQELTRQQYQQNLDEKGGIYAPQSVKEQAFRDAQTQEQVNRQNVLMNNLSSKINEIYSQKGMQRHIAESAEKLNMSVEEYVDKYVTPEIMNYAQKALTMRNQEEIMPHGALDYIAKNLSNSIIGMVVAPSVMSRDTRQRLQEGIAIADGDAEIQKVAGHKDETYRSGIGTRFASTAVNMAADSGPLAVIGAGASAAVNAGTRVLTNGLVKAGVMKAAQKLTAQQMAFKVANMTTAQKIMSGLGTRTATGALNLAGYSGVTAALNQASTGDDTSLQAIGEVGLKGAEHGAVTGAMFGVSGAIMSPWVSKFGITGMEKSTGERLLHGAQKFGATAAGLGVEAGTMMVADNVTGDKDISFGTWLEDVVMVGAFKAGEPSNFVKMGNILHHLTHNSGGNFVIGKNANGSPIAVDIRLTPDEKNELISSASGKNLMDAFVKVDRASKTAPRDPKYKTAYTDFMNDPDVSQSTKEKVNAAMGLFNTTRGKSYRSVNDVKNKQILEYTKNGTLLTRTSYKNADERRAILYKQKLYRDNDDMMSLMGYARMKDMQFIDDDGTVTNLAFRFLKENGYDENKDITDPNNARLINELRNQKSALYLDWEKYADKNGLLGYLRSESKGYTNNFMASIKELLGKEGSIVIDIDKIMRKDPMKRTDEENRIFYHVKRALEDELFPSWRPHADQSASQGKTVAEEHSLGTDNPDSGVVVDELRNLRNAEQALDAAMDSNDVFKQTFEKLHQQGLTPAQIYDALIQNGLLQEELTPLAQYINANARVQGMQQATADAIEENVKSFISDWSYHGTLNGQAMNGEQALYVQDSSGRTLLVGSGDVAFDQTTGRAKEGSGDMLVCLDPNTKELVYVKADDVTLFQNQPIDQFAAEYRQRLQMKNSEPYNQAAQEQAMLDADKPQQEDNNSNIKKDELRHNRIYVQGTGTSGTGNIAETEGTGKDTEGKQEVRPSRKFADGSDVPMATDSKGRPTPDYASMTPEQSAEILTEDFGENAEKVVDGQIKKAENALKDAEKMKVDYTAEPNDIMEQETLKNQTIEAAKKQLDHAQNIKKAMTAKKVAETVGKTEQTEGAHEAGSVAAQKFVNAPRLVGNKRTRMLPDGETKIKGHYEIVPAESLTPSHDVNNDYKKSEGFPTDAEGRTVNDRDYEHDKAAQQNTDQIARKYNGMAIEQVPVVSDEGIVYDGNGRTMAGQKAAKEGTDGEYINDLLENAENFGFTREQIEQSGIEHPRLVMVTDERLPYDAATFAKFNRNEKKTQSNTEQAVAKAKTLTSDEVGAIVAEIEGNGSLDAFFNNSKAINDLVKTLVDKGIIGQNEVAQMMDSPERLSAQGREYVKNLLLGSIFKPETIRMLGIDSTVKNKAINAIRSVMDNMKLGEFSLRDEIDQAIQLLYEARQGGNKVDTLLRTPDMFGEDAAKRYSSISQMMALALEGKVSDFRDLLDEYNRIAKARNTGEGNMFEAAPTKEELINEYLNFKKWQDYGTGHSEIEGSNDVSSVEEPQQEASGGNEPAEARTEPERPRVEEPDDLVNKELESRIKVTDEETETPSKYGPIMKQKIVIDGDKEVMKVDEPNKKGEYTGSYYEYDGKKFGDLNEVTEYIDSKNEEGPLPLLPKEEKPDPQFNPIEAAAAEFKKEHPLTEEEIMKAEVDDLSKDMALDYLNGEVTDDLHRAIYESIFAKTRGQKTEPKVETPKTEPSADPMEGIKNAAEGFEKEKKSKTDKKPQQTADDAAVAASNKKVNDLWDMLKNAGKNEISASFIGLNSRQLEVLPKLVSAMAENAYLRIKRGMHNLEDVVKEMRKEFAPAAKLFKKEDVDAIYEQMMNIRYRDGEQRMSLKEWADYYEKTSPKHQKNLVGDSKTAEERKMAEKKFIDVVKLKLVFKHKFNGIVDLRKIAERVGLKDIKDTDLQELAETAIVQRARGIASSESTNDAVKFERIKTLYENQPSLNQRDSERVMKQQYSTPAPYAFLADMYVKGNGKVIESALEPSAGNGMLTIGLPMDKVHVNDIDAQRLANLRRQGFKNVTSQDGTQPFADKDVDVVVTNPPFGSATPKEYDGYKISSLEGQMAINALESMKDNGRAAIIIGGKTEYAKNGSLNPKDKAFLGYLYSHYNVEDVINVDGSLYAKQGTSYPTRIILINGRRLNENAFPPVKDKARAEAVKDYDELYKRIEDDILRGERMDSSIGGETRSAQPELDKQGAAGTPKARVRAGERGGSKPDGERESDLFDSTSVSGTHDDLENQRGTEPRQDGGLPNGDSRTDGTGAEPSPSKEPTTGTNEQRGNGSGGAGRNDAHPSTDESANAGSGSGPRGQLQRVDKSVRGLSTEKVTYTPKSGNPFTLKAVMPADQQEAVNKNLEKLGDADQFLVDELGYNDKDDLYSHLAAEQVDSVALALQQAKKGNAFIIGDMTGIGKGRQAASLIRYAKKQGQVPVYFTKTAGLLSDVYRDLVDIGSPELRPFVFGSAKEAAITDSDGKVVFALPSKSEVKRVLDYIEKNGKLPDEYDYVLTTYSQVSNGVYEFDENGARKEKKLAKGKTFGAAALSGQRRRDAIEKLMGNAYLILDESHTAGGNSGQGNYFQHIIQKAKNVTFFSATFAKRPDNMPIYALRTAMNEGGMKSSDLIDAVKRGGATLQEIMSQTLTQCGQMIRRERDMTGVTIDWKAIDDPERVQEQREQYDSIIGLFNDIINFQKKYVSSYVDERNDELAAIQSTIGIKKGTAALGIKNQPFASKAFNTVQQVLLSLKAKSAAERAIDYLKQGMKPVIALNNTNESQTGNLALGEEMDAPDLGTSLKKGLEGTLRYTQKDAKDNSESGYIKLSDLGDEAVEAYHELEKKIEQTSTGLSLSPIDVIKNELQKAGYKVGELTGRQTEFVYNDNGTVTKVKRADTDKKKLARDFNDGKIDALILNKSAATGISLHASSKYKDQKKRVMIVAQQQLDVNDEVQMRGRIDRTGQVARGAYEYVVSLIPAEQRLLMMFKAKLKSLDANTTSSQKSKFNEMEVADITNKYGDKVVKEYMAEHLDLYARMADPFGWEKSNGDDLSRIDPQTLVASGGGVGDGEAGADASKLLGRMALLRVSEQEKMLQEIGELYANEIQRLNEMGENDLEITELPLKAKTLHKEVWKQGAEPGGDNAFADNTYIEKVNMAILKKPMKASEVKASQDGLTGGKTWDEYKTDKKPAVKEYFDQKIADASQKYEERAVKTATKAKEKYIKDAKKGQKDSGMSDEQIEKMAGYQYDNIYNQEKDKLNDVVKNLKSKAEMFERVLDTFDTNQTFVLPTDMNNPNELSGFGNSYGRLIDIKITDNFSPNASSVSFATLDGRRKITFPIAGKVGAGENKADVISAIDNMTKQAIGMGDSHLRVLNQDLNNWDRLTSNESRKNGYIVTGNLMQALVDSKDQGLGGQLVKYTTDTGEVKTGILMPDRFDPKGLTTDAPINSVTDKFELSSWHGGIDEVTSSDGEVKVKRVDNNRGYFYELRVPKSKAKGGKYFMDEDLLKLVNGNNFETRGNNMLAEFKPEQLKPVLDRLSKMGVKVQEERNTSEDEGTHFREDRGLQYSKTDTKDVKNSRIIPEDVDKNVSSQIEKRFDDEVERLYGDSSEKPNVEKEANKYATKQYIDTFKYDKKGNPIQKYEGLKSVIDSLDSKLKDIEQRYGFNRKSDINEIKSAIGTETAEGNDSRGMGGVSQGDSVRISGRKGVLSDYKETALSLAAAQRAKEYLLERFNNIRLKYGLEEGDWASKEQVERIFNDYNSDADVKKIFDRIAGLVDVLGTKLKGEAYKKVNTEGYYYHPKNYILIDTDFLSSIQFGKQELASTICHEMLHVVTSDIINLYRKGHGDLLNERQRKAAKEVVDLYDEIKSYFDKHIGGTEPYALKNPAEMITELANPEWRKIVAQIPAQKGWFRRIFNAIKKMLGFHVDTTTDLDRLDKALENVIRNLDYERFQKGAELNDEIVNKKVTDPEELDRLNKEKTFRMYSGMQEVDGKLYSPMAAIIDGKRTDATEIGAWMGADERPDLVKNGKFTLVKTDKNKGVGEGDVPAADNPYMHTSTSMMNDQFTGAYARGNIKVVEWEIPESEKTSGYHAEGAKDAVGLVPWHSGSVNSLLPKDRQRQVMLSRWRKAVRVVPDSEVAESIAEQLKGTGLAIPWNVVTPNQVRELAKLGVPITTVESGRQAPETKEKFLQQMADLEQEFPQAKFVNVKMTKDSFKEWGKDGGTKFRTDNSESSYPTSSVENHVENVAQKTGAKVNMVSSVDEITNKAAKAAIEEGRKITGWYDEKTGEVHLYMPNIHDRYTAEKTIWHEVVGHKGMRELFGDERFDKFLREVWYDLDKPENAALKKLVDEERKFNPLNIYDAIEEGIARLAEDGKGEPGFWNGIKNKVSDFLHEIGYRIAPNTKDVKYLLWLSKNLQKNPNDPYWKLRAEAVKYRLDHERMPAVVAHDGMFYGNDGKVRSMDNLTKAEWNEATDGEIHFRTTPSAGTALDRYHRSLDEHGYMFTESYMDNMLSLKKLMNAIVPDKKIEDIASSENPYILQNTMQGAMSDAAQMFERNVMKPLDKAMADVLDAFDGKKDDEKIRNFNLYMITKHGLERNRILYVRDALKYMRMNEKTKKLADTVEFDWNNEKATLDEKLERGDINLKTYYERMDDFIRTYVDSDNKFEAGEHDYSGIHAIQEVAKSSDPYNDAEAIQNVMDSEAKMESIKNGAVKDYWDKVKAATQYSIDSDYKNGIISKELHGHVSNMFNWYVPLRKYDEATAEDTYGYITEQGDPKSYIGSTIMRARGHKYLSETNVLAQIGAMGNRAIKNGGMNAIRQAFARFVRNNSNNNLVTETRVWYADDPITHTTVERYPDIPEGATADEINQIVADFNMEMKDLESKGLATKVYRRGRIGYKFQRAENKSQHIVDVKIAGRTHTFIINGNPRAAQALNGLLENSGAKGIMKPLSSISRMMAQLCTSYNPEFVMRNIMRDAEFASSNVTSKEGARYGALWAKYYAQLGLYKGASNISFKDLSGTTGLGLFAKYRNGTLDTSDKVQRYFKEFMENGGETGWVQIKNMQDWTKEYKKDVKSERSKIDKGGAALRDFFFGNLADINEVAENIARFATYCASRDSNRSIIRSVYDAKEVSTNFNRHGSGDAIKSFKNGEMTGGKAAARWAYGFTASYLRHCSMFFNAGIQSTNLLVKNLKNHPVGTSINMLAIPFALGALAALGNNVLIASEDEKDRKGVKDPYGELPDYIRRNNLCIYKGGGEFVTIPLAIELRAFYGLGDLAAGLTFSPNVSGQKNPALDAVGCMSQLVPVMDYLGNSSAGKEPLNETIKAISPSALSPFVEWEMNTDWKGAPIERRGDWNKNSPAWQRAYKGVPDGYMAVNKWVNAQTNDVAKGNEDMLGNSFLDMVTNPSMLNHYIGGLGGGAATFTERAIGVIKHGSDTETKDIPFLRSLLYTPSEQSSLQRTKSKWYNYKDEMEKTMANVDRLKSKNVPIDKRITNIGEYFHFQNSKEAAKVRIIDLAEKQMKRWKKLRDKSSDTESINFANQNIDRIMMDAVDELDRLE
uniref:strawberry notch C-terminal domain-containing protein n=1 Tax=Prevotella sp. TaxID=59823 RepID=UPI0025D01AFA